MCAPSIAQSTRTSLPLPLVLAAASAACQGPLPQPGPCRCEDDEASAVALEVSLEPSAPLDAAPAVVRIHLRAPADGPPPNPPLDPERFVLVQGAAGPAQLGQLAREEISAALAERMLPTLAWSEDEYHVVLVPTVPLEAEQPYAVASGAPKFTADLVVRSDDPLPTWPRIWPPVGESASSGIGVWCGDGALPLHSETTVLVPDPWPGSLATGALRDDQGGHCLRFVPATAEDTVADAERVPPPLWPASAEPVVRLDPRPLAREAPVATLVEVPCDESQQPLGPGCVTIFDDRLLVTPPDARLLWSVAGGGLDAVIASHPSEPFVLRPLPTGSWVELSVIVADVAGQVSLAELGAHTLPAMAHLVLNEVLANPVGVEPTQEWVELYNDGAVTAALGEYALEDVGGHTPLPMAALPPGRFALLVNEDYDETDDLDPLPAQDTLLLRIPELGHNGLNNQGEPLKLLDGAGRTVSRFPAEPKPKSGVSVIRVHPGAPDGAASSFARAPAEPTPGSPNRPEG